MPKTELKPTTGEERERWKHHATSEILLPAPYYWQTILRLIADVDQYRDRLATIVAAHENQHNAVLGALISSAREALNAKD